MQAEIKDAYWKLFDTEDLTTKPPLRNHSRVAGLRRRPCRPALSLTWPAEAMQRSELPRNLNEAERRLLSRM